MAHDDPFTLDLFGNPAIAPGLGLGVTAFALLERSRWSTVVLGVGALAVAVMLARMQIIWSVPVG